ncbi:dynein regulatory complex protein 12 isoform X3 [Pogona vitticeps]
MGKTELQGRQRSMAPTKKGKRKKAGKQNRKTAPDDEQHRKTMLEVDTLKQHLVLQRDIARRAMSDSERLKQRLADLEEELERAQGDKKDIYEAACQEEAQQSRAERAEMLEEKRTTLAEMQHKMDQMETEYEKILHASLDRVVSKLQTAKISWEKEATAIHLEYKDQLKEFGLNPLEF